MGYNSVANIIGLSSVV